MSISVGFVAARMLVLLIIRLGYFVDYKASIKRYDVFADYLTDLPPMLGLFGTFLGLFVMLNQSDAVGNQLGYVLIEGLGTAMQTTLFGMAAAVIASGLNALSERLLFDVKE